jgi:transposase
MCQGVQGRRAVKIAPLPRQNVTQSIAIPRLLAYVLLSEFCDAIAFYRHEKQFRRASLELMRVDFFHWAIQVVRQCDPVSEVLLDAIRAGPVVQVDEIRLQVM